MHSLWPIILLLGLGGPDAGAADAGVAPPPARVSAFDLRWSLVTTRAAGPPRVIGQPGAGCLQGAAALPLRAPAWIVAHPERHREFGHPSLVAYVRKLAAEAARRKIGPLYVGDLGQPRGGPTPTGHRSHQNGLDVDLWYWHPAKPFRPGKTPVPSAPSVVDLRTKKMSDAWTPKVALLVQLAASSPEVDRIFVHPSVKRALCQDRDNRGPWLERVRPWWGHDDHLHVRLVCPEDSPDCDPSPPLPPGDGCGALAWWFSEDARKAKAKRGAPGENAPPMPEACDEVLQTPSQPSERGPAEKVARTPHE